MQLLAGCHETCNTLRRSLSENQLLDGIGLDLANKSAILAMTSLGLFPRAFQAGTSCICRLEESGDEVGAPLIHNLG